MKPEEVLKEIANSASKCKRCKLHHSRRKAVPGAGNPQAKIMFIGEAPGFHENQQGFPFVGAAGQFLDELLAEAGLDRETVFITNVVKCRPPGNRDPHPEELEACKPFLERQIAAVNPDVIVTLGRYSMGNFIHNAMISAVHGSAYWSNGRMIIPMFHPAAALHQPSLRSTVKDDFAKLPKMIRNAKETRLNNPDLAAMSGPAPDEDQPDDSSAEQLSLF